MAPVSEEITLLVQKQYIGAVIGKEGKNVKDVRDATGCQIQTQKDLIAGKYRSVEIRGENACAVPREILVKIASDNEERDDSGEEKRMLLQIRLCGKITGYMIGKGGAQIKQFRENHPTVNIKVEDNSYPGDRPDTKYMELDGSITDLIQCVEEVCECYRGAPMEAAGGDRGGDRGRGGNMDHHGGRGGNMDHMGNKGRVGRDRSRSPRRDNNMGGGRGGSNMMRNSNMMGGGGGGDIGGLDPSEVCGEVAFCIPDHVIGGVIGKGGDNIKHIRGQSMAQISTDKQGDSQQGMREMRISGNFLQIQDAINELGKMFNPYHHTHFSNPQGRGGGGGHGGGGGGGNGGGHGGGGRGGHGGHHGGH